MDTQTYHGHRDAETLVKDIEETYVTEEGPPSNPKSLRPSSIGEECGRAVQLSWLWVTAPKRFCGRMLSLFKTGHRIEAELLVDLKRAGWEVIERDPENPNKQISIQTLDGHSFGYADGIGRDRKVNGPWALIECKSHKGESFRKTKKHGVANAKSDHYAQMQLYMHILGLKLAVYIMKCKDTDDKWIEYVPYDAGYCERLLDKGKLIVGKKVLLPRISSKPDFFKCRFCDHRTFCHEGKTPEKNCRTCEHSRPVADGKWGCEKHQCLISKELMKAGCDDYELAKMLGPTDVE